MRVMAGDVGGTKTLLQIAEHTADGWQVLAHKRYENRRFADFESVLADFRQTEAACRAGVDDVCLAVAGPVDDDAVRLTNLDWSIDAGRLRAQAGFARVRLLNDLECAGYGVACVDPSRLDVLHAGRPVINGVQALIGAGTGLGEAWMAWCNGHYDVFAGEGGHVDFAPRDEFERDLLVYLSAKLGRVSYEHVLSGAGLQRLFEFELWRTRASVSPALARELAAGDPAAVISAHASSNDNAPARAALERYISIYGARAANLALTVGATGGVYIVGGIAPKISVLLRGGGFMQAFLDHPAMAALLDRIPVTAVLDENAALLGARAATLHEDRARPPAQPHRSA